VLVGLPLTSPPNIDTKTFNIYTMKQFTKLSKLECKSPQGIVTLSKGTLYRCFVKDGVIEIPASFTLSSRRGSEYHPTAYVEWATFLESKEEGKDLDFKVWNSLDKNLRKDAQGKVVGVKSFVHSYIAPASNDE